MIVVQTYHGFRTGVVAAETAEMVMTAFNAFVLKVSATSAAFAAAPVPPFMATVAVLLAIAAVFSQRRGRDRLLMLVLAVLSGVTAWLISR